MAKKQVSVRIGSMGRTPGNYQVAVGTSVAKALSDVGFVPGRTDSVSLNGSVLADPSKTKIADAEGVQVILVNPRVSNG